MVIFLEAGGFQRRWRLQTVPSIGGSWEIGSSRPAGGSSWRATDRPCRQRTLELIRFRG